jgi:hypothetical protein
LGVADDGDSCSAEREPDGQGRVQQNISRVWAWKAMALDSISPEQNLSSDIDRIEAVKMRANPEHSFRTGMFSFEEERAWIELRDLPGDQKAEH